MPTKEAVIEEAIKLGFADVGFTTAEPFHEHKNYLMEKSDDYSFMETAGYSLTAGSDPRSIMPSAKSAIVLLEVYFKKAYPRYLEGHFGRCYLDDDRMTRDGLSRRIKAFRSFLRDNGIDSKVSASLPHRMTAVRAGMGTVGRNCLFYSNTAARGGSWTLPIPVLVDHEFTPGTPTYENNCPKWCRNVCIAACPTRALKGNGRIDPKKCISYLTYYGSGPTPIELREPMGMYVYGCDRCQDVCPRNRPWTSQDLAINEKAAAMEKDFRLESLLHMDASYFEAKIWPHMFYMPSSEIWRWKMNVARVMGNSLDPVYAPELLKAFHENTDDRVKCLTVWALGKLGQKKTLNNIRSIKNLSENVKLEVESAISAFDIN